MNIFHIIFVCEIYIILSLSANLVSGYTGLLSFANAAFYGLGAYTTALLMKKFGFNFFATLPFAMLLNVGFSFIVSFLSVRLKDLYFTLATIAFQIIIFNLLYNLEAITGGSFGLSEIPAVEIGNIKVEGSLAFCLMGAVFLSLILLFFVWLRKTPFLRVLTCIRDNELGSVSIGKNVAYYKYVCNALAACLMAISGSLFAVYNAYIDPSSFTLDESILIVSMILIGGTGGSLWGPIFGACFYVILPELIRLVPIQSTQGASLQMIIYSLILILVIRFKPNGLFGKFKFE